MTLAEFFSWQAYARRKSAELDRMAPRPADNLPALADLPPAALGRAIAGR